MRTSRSSVIEIQVGKYNVINNYATTDQELMFGIHEIDVQDQTVCLSIYKSIVGVVNLNYKNNYMLLGFEDPGKNKNYNYQTNIVYDFYYTEEMLQTPGLF